MMRNRKQKVNFKKGWQGERQGKEKEKIKLFQIIVLKSVIVFGPSNTQCTYNSGKR